MATQENTSATAGKIRQQFRDQLNAWCKEHRYGISNKKQWERLVTQAAEEIDSETDRAGYQNDLRNCTDWWWENCKAGSPYWNARKPKKPSKPNPLRPTALDKAI